MAGRYMYWDKNYFRKNLSALIQQPYDFQSYMLSVRVKVQLHFFVASIVGFMMLLGAIKFFPDIRFKNPDCDFQQKQQTNITIQRQLSDH